MGKNSSIKVEVYKSHRNDWERILSTKNILSDNEQKKFDSYKIQNDKKRFYIGRAILKQIIGNSLNIQKNDIVIAYNNYGKPYLVNNTKIHFNISHSGDWVVVAFASSDVGIDIQEVNINKKIDIPNVAKHAFHPDEISVVNKLENKEKLFIFYKIWRLKEAFIKAKGLGLYQPLEQISILPALKKEYSIIENLSLSHKEIDQKHIMAVAVESSIPFEIKEYNFKVNI